MEPLDYIPMGWERPVELLKKFIEDIIKEETHFKPSQKLRVDVYFWSKEAMDKIGMRISEISISHDTPGGGMAGVSWMRADIDACALVLAAEDYLIEHFLGLNEPGELERVEWKLKELLTLKTE